VDFVAGLPIPERLREPLRAALRGERADWPEPLTAEELRTLTEHGVAPLVYAAVHLPQLRGDAIRAAAIERARADDLRGVLEALAARGVEALLLKGTALAYQIYPEPELRPRGDTDLLIAAEAVETVREVLQGLGFAGQVTSGDDHGVRQTLFTRPPGMVYDVHWAATNAPLFDTLLRYEQLRRDAVAVPPLGPHALALAPVDALLLACIHRVAHHHDSDRLIWLADIALLRDRMSPGEHRQFWRLAAEARVVAICSRSIELADFWMSRPPHNRAAEWLSQEEMTREESSAALLDRDITHGRLMVANLRALPWSARLTRLRQLAFPPREFMRQSFGARSALALPWWYAYRGARGVLRLFRRAAR
jgi:hypothetical protein